MPGLTRGLAWLLVTSILASCAPAAPSQAPTATGRPGSTRTGAAGESPGTGEPIPLPSVELAALPEPAALPAGPPAESARALVPALRGVDPLPAVLGALVASGIPVLGDDGRPIEGSDLLGGLAVLGWEARIMADLADTEGGLLLSDVGEMLAGTDPALAGAPMADLLLADIKSSYASPDPDVAFWAALIVELGRQRPDGLDLLTLADPEAVALDYLQVEFLLRRAAADIVRASEPATSQGGIVPAVAGRRRTGGHAAAAPNPPCRYSEAADRVVTGVEETVSRGIGAVLDHLEGVEELTGRPGVGRLAKYVGIAGMLADIATFAAIYAALTVTIELEGGAPLVRTKKERPQTGERRMLRATVRNDVGRAESINCLRLVFAHLGITFSVPPDGPIAGASTQWVPLEGFDARVDRIVQFHGGNPSDVVTDSSGVARIGVEGFGQEQEITEAAAAVEKRASLHVLVQIKDAGAYRDTWDAITTGLDVLGGISAVLTVALELLQRTRWLKPTRYSFAVRDWGEEFRIDHTIGGSADGGSWEFRYSGTKCDGVEGEWVIDLVGSLSTPDGSGTFDGTIFVQIPRGSMTGQMGGTSRFRITGAPAGADTTFGGTGTFVPGPPPMLRLKATGGTGTGFAFGYSASGDVQGGELDLPVEVGDFCE